MFIELIKAAVLGGVEGISEWLPISSTGHMILVQDIIKMNVTADFWDVFLVVIQLGAILAVIDLYFRTLNPFSRNKNRQQRKATWSIWGKILVGSIPAALVGLALDSWAEEHLDTPLVVAIALVVYGIAFLVIELHNRRNLAVAEAMGLTAPERLAAYQGIEADSREELSDTELDPSSAISKVNDLSQLGYGRAFLIGCFQSLAVVPGTSRSGSTIIGSMLVGTNRSVATEFAFFLAIPIMFGWSLLKFVKHGFGYTPLEWGILAIGCIVAFVVSLFSIRFLVGYVKRHDFRLFGWYRIVLGVIVIAYFAATGQLFTIVS